MRVAFRCKMCRGTDTARTKQRHDDNSDGAYMSHTRKQALSVLHHIKTTRPHLDSAPRSRFISGSISFPLPVLKHSSTPSSSLHRSNNKSALSAGPDPRSPVGGMDGFRSTHMLMPSPVLPPQMSPNEKKQGAFASLAA